MKSKSRRKRKRLYKFNYVYKKGVKDIYGGGKCFKKQLNKNKHEKEINKKVRRTCY